MKLSILTVCLNSEATIADTLNSVLQQDFQDYECIVFDGGSTDETLEIVKSFGTRVKLIRGRDSGIFDAMNQAIGHASGEIVGILNSDDFYTHSGVFSRVIEAFDKYNVDSVYGDLVYVKRDNVDRIWRVWKAGPFDKSKFRIGWVPPHPTFFVKRCIYEKYGMFDKSFDISGDYELLLRFLYKHDVSTTYIPDFLVKMRTGGNSSGNLINRFKSMKEDLRSWQTNELKPGPITIPLKVLCKLPQFFHGNSIPKR